MADNRYGGDRREGWQGRGDSIFPDDDDRRSRGSGRWSGDHQRDRAGDDDRGFFERAGDEVRSWFGDEEAERRRELDARREEGRFYGVRSPDRDLEGGRGGGRAFPGSAGSGFGTRFEPGGSAFARERGGQGGFGGGRSQWDDHYRAWRDRQIEQFDREYEDYCRERQHRFEQDFDSWRGSRLTEGGTAGRFGGGSGSGETFEAAGEAKVRSGAVRSGQADAGGTPAATGAGSEGSGTAAGGSTLESGGGRGGRTRN